MPAESSRAVFLSYASQDAEAARRICESLRAGGVEVWFDADGGLEHGDEWDAKIRRQIKECVLFIPVISANTQARHEGYFRIEWDLAAERARGIASGVPFILPVVIDDTREPDALVPDRFRAVQWTRLRGGEVPAEVQQRFLKLWSHRTGAIDPYSEMSRAGPSPLPALFSAAAFRTGDKSVAVLPFANQSSDKDNEYFSDGIAEELLTTLQKIPGLRVSARTSAWSFKGKPATAQEVGEILGMAHVVEGSVQKSGNRVKVTARLSRTATNEQLWSKSFGPFELNDVFATQSELAEAIVVELRGKLGGGGAAITKVEIHAQVVSAQRGGTKVIEALQLFLRGRSSYARGTSADVARGIEYFEQAGALDAQFASAWVAIARARVWQGSFEPLVGERFHQARLAAEQALAVEPGLAEAHSVMATVMQRHFFDWQQARTSAARALQLAPTEAAVLMDVCSLGVTFGEWDVCFATGQQAAALDPINAEPRLYLAVGLFYSGRLAEAETEIRRVLELAPATHWARLLACQILVAVGRPDEALAEAQKEPDPMHRLAAVALAAYACGRLRESDAARNSFEAEFTEGGPFQLAEIYAQRGATDQAFRWLEHTWQIKEPGVCLIRSAFTLRNLHGDPRWPALLKKIGLHEDQLR
jgi:TolB-like protein/tetratricopeptide (TPR) repeat protein